MGASPIHMLIIVGVLAVALISMPTREPFDGQDTIFVSIASYRDVECGNTVRDIFAKARHPERVFLGICEQNTSQGKEYCTVPEFEHSDNIRLIKIPYREAKGPTYARYLCSTLYRDETYFMQIDSHMRFVQDWDVKVIDEHSKCPDQPAVLSTYPLDWGTESAGAMPVLCKSEFNGDGILQLEAVLKEPESDVPSAIPFASGGFFFGPGSVVTTVPFDPTLDHLFQGEEVLYSARLWTHGFNMYSPTQTIMFHKYTRNDEPKFWDEENDRERARSVKRVLKLFDGALPGYAYGFGKKRSLDAYWKFANVKYGARRSASQKKFC